MNDDDMSDNYRLRKHFLSTQEVPSQSFIKKKMSEPLAAIYFKSMKPELKVLVGLEPSMKGGGSDWYAPPKDLLEGRTVLKPFKREYMSSLNYIGVDNVCMKIIENRDKNSKLETNKVVSENDEKWKKYIKEECEQLFNDYCCKAAKRNTQQIQKEFKEFSTLYAKSLATIETIILDAASSEINRIKNEEFQKIQEKYRSLIKQQNIKLCDTYKNKLMTENLRLKSEFIEALESNREEMRHKIHDLKLETHVNVEKVRKFCECQRLACQVYVALKEKEEYEKDKMHSDHMHKKKVRTLNDEILTIDYGISVQKRKETSIQLELDKIWEKKILYLIKHLQRYVSYCLNLLPEHADFFINMEKLMLEHCSDILEDQNAESIFSESYEGPSADPRPFYLFCDRNQKINELSLQRDLCPKPCTSCESQMPMIVINKRCMYAACDNFEQFTNKAKHYIHGERGDDADFVDDYEYEHAVPVKCITPKQSLEFNLDRTSLQVLNHELFGIGAVACKCSCLNIKQEHLHAQTEKQGTVSQSTSAGNMFNISKKVCKTQAVGPYLKSIQPKQCTCAKTTNKHLVEHLPVYMDIQSGFDTAKNFPTYETCPLETLKRLVREARRDVTLLPKDKTRDEDKTRDVATQYADEQYENLCTCFSDDMIIINDLNSKSEELLFKLYRPSSNVIYFQSPSVSLSFDSFSTRDKDLGTPTTVYPELDEIFKIIEDEQSSNQLRRNSGYNIRSNLFSVRRLDNVLSSKSLK